MQRLRHRLLPCPTWPYAKIVPLYPAMRLSTTSCARVVYAASWLTFSNTPSNCRAHHTQSTMPQVIKVLDTGAL